MWLFDAEVYTNMSSLNEATDITKRGMCLHKVREKSEGKGGRTQ
jgi:hypothetical protein